MKRVLVIGSGLSGLTFSHYLKKMLYPGSLKITILEEKNDIGGIMQTHYHHIGGNRAVQYFSGPKTCRISDPKACALISMANDVDLMNNMLLAHKNSTHTFTRYIYYKNKLVHYPTFKLSYIFPEFFLSEAPFTKGCFFSLIFSYMNYMYRNDFAIAERSLGEFLKNYLTESVMENFVTPIVRGIAGTEPENLAADIFLREFQKRFRSFYEYDRYSDNIYDRDIISTDIYGNKKFDSSLTYLGLSINEMKYYDWKSYLSIPTDYSLIGFENGFNSLLQATASQLVDQTEHEIILSEKVTSIKFNPDTNLYSVYSDKGHCFEAEHLISTLNSTQLFKLLDSSRIKKILNKMFNHTSLISVTSIYPLHYFKNPIVGFGFLVPKYEDSNALVMAQQYDSYMFSHIFNGRYDKLDLSGMDTLNFTTILSKEVLIKNNIDPEDDDAILNIVRDVFKKLYRVGDDPIFSKVFHLDNSLPRFNIGYLNTFNNLKSNLDKIYPNFHLIGHITGYYGMNSLAVEAAKKAYEIASKHLIKPPS